MNDASEIIRTVYDHGGRLLVTGGNLELRALRPLPAELLERLRRNKPKILAALYERDFDERAAIAQFDGGIPVEWIEGFAKLQTMPPPCDIRPDRWRQIINDAGLFLDRWASQATAFGWSTNDVFGIHESKPHGGIHCSGLVALICGNAVTAIANETAAISHANGTTLTYYRRRSKMSEQVPIWELQP